MFVQNQIAELGNHRSVIIDAMARSEEMRFIVAYVRENGVDIILNGIKNKPAKLICSFDMGITQLSGIKKLIENGVEVKVYRSSEGTFHPKVWLFGNNRRWKTLIGSANLTRAALVDNVEASVLLEDRGVAESAVMFFNYLWDRENSQSVTLEEIDVLRRHLEKRNETKKRSARVREISATEQQKSDILFQFVKDWIDIPKFDKTDIGHIWRGWYIIPDHGYVTDDLMERMRSYLPFIGGGVALAKDNPGEKYGKLLGVFRDNSRFQRDELKMSMHELFVRQAKNYLIKFGWARHSINEETGKLNKRVLHLTSLGERVNQCVGLGGVKRLYTEYFLNYSYNGLRIVEFTKSLLRKLSYLTLEEFDYFVVHAYNDGDLDTIVDLVRIYRSLSDSGKMSVKKRIADYFSQTKERTANTVHGNYLKNVKHTITAIAWCDGFLLGENFAVKLSDED